MICKKLCWDMLYILLYVHVWMIVLYENTTYHIMSTIISGEECKPVRLGVVVNSEVDLLSSLALILLLGISSVLSNGGGSDIDILGASTDLSNQPLWQQVIPRPDNQKTICDNVNHSQANLLVGEEYIFLFQLPLHKLVYIYTPRFSRFTLLLSPSSCKRRTFRWSRSRLPPRQPRHPRPAQWRWCADEQPPWCPKYSRRQAYCVRNAGDTIWRAQEPLPLGLHFGLK